MKLRIHQHKGVKHRAIMITDGNLAWGYSREDFFKRLGIILSNWRDGDIFSSLEDRQKDIGDFCCYLTEDGIESLAGMGQEPTRVSIHELQEYYKGALSGL